MPLACHPPVEAKDD